LIKEFIINSRVRNVRKKNELKRALKICVSTQLLSLTYFLTMRGSEGKRESLRLLILHKIKIFSSEFFEASSNRKNIAKKSFVGWFLSSISQGWKGKYYVSYINIEINLQETSQ